MANNKVIFVNEDESVCGNCTYFYQHYGWQLEGGYYPLNCGHCCYKRCKSRKPGEEGCYHWKERE